jgi:hypothetical protein
VHPDLGVVSDAAGSRRGSAGYLDGVEGGISIFLFLLILGGAGVGAVLLFGSGGYLRKKQLDGELGDDGGGSGARPTHMRVEDESDATQEVPSPTPTSSGAGERPPPPPE